VNGIHKEGNITTCAPKATYAFVLQN